MIRISMTLPEKYLEALDAVAKVKGRTRSQQLRETLLNDPDFYEVYNELQEGLKKNE